MTLPTHYPSKSKGLTPIAEMAHSHLVRTVAALKRDGGDPLMIAAMEQRIAELDAMPDDAAEEACRETLARAYNDFVASSPLQERVFKVLKDAVAPANMGFVALSDITDADEAA